MSERRSLPTDPAPTDPAARLLRPAEPGRFDPAELDGLAAPVRRHLTQAIAPGTALHTSARLTMRGQIKVGVRWAAPAGDRVTAAFAVGETPLELELRLDGAGRIVSLQFDRWGDPGDGRFGWHRFGGEITGYAGFAGLTIPSAGRLGWFHGSDRWEQGEFFRYRITGLEPAGPAAEPR